MRVLLVAPQPFYRERGTPIAVRLLAETLCAAGHEVDLLTYHEGENIDAPGLRIIRIAGPPLVRDVPIGFSWKKLVCDLYLSAKMASLVWSNDYGAIHAVEESVFPAALLNLRGRRKLVYDMDSLMADQLMEKWSALRVFGPVFRALEGWAVRRADVILPVCGHIANRAAGYRPKGKVFVLEDVPLPGEDSAGEAEDLREIFHVTRRLGLYVGNLEPYQGIDLLLKGLAELAGGDGPEVVVIGGDPRDVDRYRRLAEELGVSGRVHFAGSRPVAHLNAYLAQADFLVSPRVKGGNTPMKIYSYMASGKPLLATDIDSHTQVLDGTCALLVLPEPEGMAAGLKRMAGDVPFGERIGSAAARLAAEKYSIDAFRRKVGEIYAYLA